MNTSTASTEYVHKISKLSITHPTSAKETINNNNNNNNNTKKIKIETKKDVRTTGDTMLDTFLQSKHNLELYAHPSQLPGREKEMEAIKECILTSYNIIESVVGMKVMIEDIRGHIENDTEGSCLYIPLCLYLYFIL